MPFRPGDYTVIVDVSERTSNGKSRNSDVLQDILALESGIDIDPKKARFSNIRVKRNGELLSVQESEAFLAWMSSQAHFKYTNPVYPLLNQSSNYALKPIFAVLDFNKSRNTLYISQRLPETRAVSLPFNKNYFPSVQFVNNYSSDYDAFTDALLSKSSNYALKPIFSMLGFNKSKNSLYVSQQLPEAHTTLLPFNKSYFPSIQFVNNYSSYYDVIIEGIKGPLTKYEYLGDTGINRLTKSSMAFTVLAPIVGYQERQQARLDAGHTITPRAQFWDKMYAGGDTMLQSAMSSVTYALLAGITSGTTVPAVVLTFGTALIADNLYPYIKEGVWTCLPKTAQDFVNRDYAEQEMIQRNKVVAQYHYSASLQPIKVNLEFKDIRSISQVAESKLQPMPIYSVQPQPNTSELLSPTLSSSNSILAQPVDFFERKPVNFFNTQESSFDRLDRNFKHFPDYKPTSILFDPSSRWFNPIFSLQKVPEEVFLSNLGQEVVSNDMQVAPSPYFITSVNAKPYHDSAYIPSSVQEEIKQQSAPSDPPKNSLYINNYNKDGTIQWGFTTKDPRIAGAIIAVRAVKEAVIWLAKSKEEKTLDNFKSYMDELGAAEKHERTLWFSANPNRLIKSVTSDGNHVYHNWHQKIRHQIISHILPELEKLDARNSKMDSDMPLFCNAMKYLLARNCSELVSMWGKIDYETFKNLAIQEYKDAPTVLKNTFDMHYEAGDIKNAERYVGELNKYFSKHLNTIVANVYYKSMIQDFNGAHKTLEQNRGRIPEQDFLTIQDNIYGSQSNGLSERLNHILELEKNSSSLPMEKSYVLSQQLKIAQERLSVYPNNSQWLKVAISALRLSGEKSKAFELQLRLMNRVQRSSADFQAFLANGYNLAIAAANEGRTTDQIYYLNEILKIDPKQSVALRLLGDAHLRSDIDRSKQYYEAALNEKVLSPEPIDYSANIRLAQICVIERDMDNAKKYLHRITDAKPDLSIDSEVRDDANHKLLLIEKYQCERKSAFIKAILSSMSNRAYNWLEEKVGKIENRMLRATLLAIPTACRLGAHEYFTDLNPAQAHKRADLALREVLGIEQSDESTSALTQYTSTVSKVLIGLSWLNEAFYESKDVREIIRYGIDGTTLISGAQLFYNSCISYTTTEICMSTGREIVSKHTKILFAPALSGTSLISSVINRRLENWRKSQEQFPEDYRIYVIEDATSIAGHFLVPVTLGALEYQDVIINLINTYTPAVIVSKAGAVAKAGTVVAEAAVAKTTAFWATASATTKVIIGIAGTGVVVALVAYGGCMIQQHYDDKHVETLNRNARLALVAGNIDEASVKLEEALNYQPDNVVAKSYKCILLLKQKNYDAAIDFSNKELEKQPDNLMFLDLRGNAYFEKEEYELAKLDFIKIRSIDGSDNESKAMASMNLGLIEKAQGNNLKGKEYLEKSADEFKKSLEGEQNNEQQQSIQNSIDKVGKHLATLNQDMQKMVKDQNEVLTKRAESFEKVVNSLQQDSISLYTRMGNSFDELKLATHESVEHAYASAQEWLKIEKDGINHLIKDKVIKSIDDEYSDVMQITKKRYDEFAQCISERIEFLDKTVAENDAVLIKVKQASHTEIEQLKNKIPPTDFEKLQTESAKLQHIEEVAKQGIQTEKEKLIALKKEVEAQNNNTQNQLKQAKTKLHEEVEAICRSNPWIQAGAQVIGSAINTGLSLFFEDRYEQRQAELQKQLLPLPDWDMPLSNVSKKINTSSEKKKPSDQKAPKWGALFTHSQSSIIPKVPTKIDVAKPHLYNANRLNHNVMHTSR